MDETGRRPAPLGLDHDNGECFRVAGYLHQGGIRVTPTFAKSEANADRYDRTRQDGRQHDTSPNEGRTSLRGVLAYRQDTRRACEGGRDSRAIACQCRESARRKAAHMEEMARAQGIAKATFDEVKRELGVVSVKVGAESWWRSPTADEQAKMPF